jgi:histidinol-phosphate/aromatic aminotransferase/cobyric acid decarboxylase-like protein/GNAT superfamily N-acetyltransferase
VAVRITIDLATEADRREIYSLRHQVYAVELHQHRENDEARLSDPLDSCNTYLKASVNGRLAGFISITPPDCPSYSIDKYFTREEFDFPFDRGLYEVRLLTVLPGYRRLACASLLMYAALRWVQSLGGTRIVAIGRLDLLALYRKAGLRSLHRRTQSGAVTYELLSATIAELGQRVEENSRTLRWLELRADWRLGIPFHPANACNHGGAFFEAIGDEFDHLERSRDVINADVLDAWFPPTPRVLAALDEYLPWLLRTSPPTNSAGMIRAIARARNLPAECIVPGAGSSALIFLCFREWLDRHSRVLLLDPSYGEYGHITDHVLQCKVERLPLDRARAYAVDLEALETRLQAGCDLAVIVNPNSPTGSYVPRRQLESVLAKTPLETRVWVDETYLEYADEGESLETFAARSQNVIVCKSMSKAYALSGTRAAYLCASEATAESLREITPPWAVSLPAQVAAVNALSDPEYYAARYRETRVLQEALADALRELGIVVYPSVANFLLCHLPDRGPDAATVCRRCRTRDVFLRDAGEISQSLGSHVVRIAVKDRLSNSRIIETLQWALATDVEGAPALAESA